jgi:hypothetical protein
LEGTAVKRLRQGLAATILAGTAAFALSNEVVVLKGGAIVPLKQPWVQRGNTAYLTRADGTLLSVSVSEIDRDATAAANQAVAPAPAREVPAASTPAEVARVTKDVPKARVRITDADVSHPLELDAIAPEEKKDQSAGGVRVEIADYTQEKAGSSLVVKGELRNPTQTTAESVRLSVSAMDEKGQSVGGANAVLSKGAIESGRTISFTATIPVPPDKNVSSLRFAPQWAATTKAPEGGAAPATVPGAPAAANKPPAPAPTPYGRGTLYAPPVANAPSQPPPDGKTGYIPGASHPDNQPKPPNP